MKIRKREGKKNKTEKPQKPPKQKKVTSADIASEYISFEECDVENGVPAIIMNDRLSGKKYYTAAIAVSGNDIFHYSEEDREVIYRNFASACSSADVMQKYIFTDIQPDFTSQKEFLEYKYKRICESDKNDFSKVMLKKRYDELAFLEQNHSDRLAYLFMYSDNKRKLDDCADRFVTSMRDTSVEILGKKELIDLCGKIMSLGTEKKDVNVSFPNESIYPESVEFSQEYFKVGNKYGATLVIYDYPAYLIDLVFASYILQSDDVSITLDAERRDNKETRNQIKRSLNELHSRGAIKQNVSDALDTQTEFDKMQNLYNDIANGNEQVFSVTLRFVVTAENTTLLFKKISEISKDLEDDGLHSFVPVNLMKDEYFGLIAPKNTVRNSFPLYDTFSRQYPFYYQQHLDPTGTLFGFTETNGCVVLNTFTRNTKRPSFDMVAIGVKGGGKSVTLKTMLEDQLLLGNKVMLIDIESEYGNLAAIYDGQIIAMTKDSAINPLQLMNSVNAGAESGGSLTMSVEEARSTNFTSEISRIITFMHQVHPTITEDEEVKFSDILADVYSKKGITKTTDLSTLSAYDFPIFSDLLTVCEEKIETADTKYEKEACQRLRSILKRLSKGGAYDIFDNYTNVNISDSSLVIFDVKALSEMDEKIYNAQLFNILSLMWGEVCKNVAVNQNIVNPFDRRNVVCLIDEAHRFISENNPQCTEFIEKLTRRSRKYFAGLWFATQSILDFLPNGLSSSSTVASKIKVIFQLVQYKVILKQDSSSVPALKEAFPQFTTSELRSATEFEPGEMLLALDSARLKIHCSRRATPANLMYMGNSHDVSDIINKIFDEKFILNNPDNMRKSDYGLQLCDKEKYENFISAFFDYVMEVLEIPSGASKYFDETVHKAVVELAKSLINEVEA